MSIIISATNAKNVDMLVSTTTEPTTVKEAVDMLPGIKSGVLVTNGKRNRVAGYVVTDTNTGRVMTFERDENGNPVQISDTRPVVKATPVKVAKSVKRVKSITDTYTHGSGKFVEIIRTRGRYHVRTFSPEIKHATKGHVIREGVDITREITRHELVNAVVPGFIDANGYRFANRVSVPA